MPITAIYGPFGAEIQSAVVIQVETGEEGFLSEDDTEPIVLEEGLFDLFPGDEVACCEPTIIKFVDKERTEIIYGAQLAAKHGNTPTVFVYYYDGEGGFTVSWHSTRESMEGSPPDKIIIDHGGVSTGILKLV